MYNIKLAMFRRSQRRKNVCLEVRETLDLQKLLNRRYVKWGTQQFIMSNIFMFSMHKGSITKNK